MDNLQCMVYIYSRIKNIQHKIRILFIFWPIIKQFIEAAVDSMLFLLSLHAIYTYAPMGGYFVQLPATNRILEGLVFDLYVKGNHVSVLWSCNIDWVQYQIQIGF